jgi:hypothetical protein
LASKDDLDFFHYHYSIQFVFPGVGLFFENSEVRRQFHSSNLKIRKKYRTNVALEFMIEEKTLLD